MAILAAGLAAPAHARQWAVAAGDQRLLQGIIDRAVDGDVVTLLAGTHRAPVRITRAITLTGEAGAILEGDGQGSVVTVLAPKAVVRGLAIKGSGRSLETMDSGVFVEKSATGAIVEDNRIEGNLFGIYLHGAENSIARRNGITGLRQGPVNENGNGVSVWNATGARIAGNDIRFGRDGVFVIASRRNVISGNRFRDMRFAVHYMYGDDGEITDNVSVGNNIGYALMFSSRLAVRGNLSKRDRDHGLMFNYANGSQITGNVVQGGMAPSSRWVVARGGDREHEALTADSPEAQPGAAYRAAPEKCVFIYNANNNRFNGNWFEGCEIGIHFTAGSERNEMAGNAFINNHNQVKYVGTRFLDWSKDGRGNYWSDNPAFDLNGDGVADAAYRPNDLVDRALWLAPQAKVLTNSPALQIIRWAQGRFPALFPGGVIDSRPLVSPPPRPAIRSWGDS